MNEPQMFADLQDAGNAQAQLVLQAIARHSDWETGECWPGDEALAKMAKCSPRTIQTYLARLEKDGLITRVDRRSESGTKLKRLITLVGYVEWISAIRDGGNVSKPKAVGKYEKPPENLSGSEQATGKQSAVTTGKHAAVTTGKQAASQEHSLNNQFNSSARTREGGFSGFGSEVVFLTKATHPQALIAWEKYAEKRSDQHEWRVVKRLISTHDAWHAPSMYPPDFAPNQKEAAE